MSGKGLLIKSLSTGVSSTVRFDETSTAFEAIIGDASENIQFINERGKNQIYGYEFKDGLNGLNGWASGLKDIDTIAVGISQNYYIGRYIVTGKQIGRAHV